MDRNNTRISIVTVAAAILMTVQMAVAQPASGAMSLSEIFDLAGQLRGSSKAVQAAKQRLIQKIFDGYVTAPKAHLSVADELRLLEALGRLGCRRIAEAIAQFDKGWAAADANGAISPGRYGQIVAAWSRVGNSARVVKWAMRHYSAALGTEKLRASVTVDDLASVAVSLSSAGLIGRDKPYPEYAQAALRLVAEGKLTDSRISRDRVFAPLVARGTRQLLQAEITSPEGAPRPGPLKLLVRSYYHAGEAAKWKAFAVKKTASADMKPDTKAGWLVAFAAAEGLAGGYSSPDLKRLEEAMTTAESQALRMKILGDIVKVYAAAARYGAALRVLDKAVAQSRTPAERTAAEALRSEIRLAQKSLLAKRKQARIAKMKRVSAARRRELQRRLAAAEQRKDLRQVARYKRLLGQ